MSAISGLLRPNRGTPRCPSRHPRVPGEKGLASKWSCLLLCAHVLLGAAARAGAADDAGAIPPATRPQPEPAPPPAPLWELFSDKGRVFSPLLADPREAQVRVGYLKDNYGDSFLDMSFGGDLGFFRVELAEDKVLSVTARGLISSRFQFLSESFDLINTDFIGGPATGFRWGEQFFELLLYHQSSHLGDDLAAQGGREPMNFSFEALRLLWSHTFIESLRVYAGPAIKVRADPASLGGDVTLQLGAEHRFELWTLPMYAAVDLQSKEEVDWDVNASFQIGVELGNPKFVFKRQRIFVEVFNGHSNMGQFFDESEFYVLGGIGFSF